MGRYLAHSSVPHVGRQPCGRRNAPLPRSPSSLQGRSKTCATVVADYAYGRRQGRQRLIIKGQAGSTARPSPLAQAWNLAVQEPKSSGDRPPSHIEKHSLILTALIVGQASLRQTTGHAKDRRVPSAGPAERLERLAGRRRKIATFQRIEG